MTLRPSRLFVFLLLPTLLLASSGCLRRSVPKPIVTGELRGDLVWSGAVLVGGDVTLAAGSTLTILPGTTVRFLDPGPYPGGASEHPFFPGSELNVQGTLTAIGTPEAPIIFASADERDPAGSWGAVNFAENSAGDLRYCIFRQADSAVHSREARVTIAESLFEDNLVGIRFHSSAMRIERNLLRGNDTGLRFHFGAPEVGGNRFEENRVNLFVTAHPRDYRIAGNSFGAPRDYQVVLGEEVPEDLLLAGNDWNGVASATVEAAMFDGRRAAYLGRVIIEPMQPVSPGEAGPSWIR